MSSMRNAVQRRSHRERGQLKEREKLGLLEKSKVRGRLPLGNSMVLFANFHLGLQTPSCRS